MTDMKFRQKFNEPSILIPFLDTDLEGMVSEMSLDSLIEIPIARSMLHTQAGVIRGRMWHLKLLLCLVVTERIESLWLG